jgi:hypothetical protein
VIDLSMLEEESEKGPKGSRHQQGAAVGQCLCLAEQEILNFCSPNPLESQRTIAELLEQEPSDGGSIIDHGRLNQPTCHAEVGLIPLNHFVQGGKVANRERKRGHTCSPKMIESYSQRRWMVSPRLSVCLQRLSPVKWCNKSGQRSAAVPDVDFSSKCCC